MKIRIEPLCLVSCVVVVVLYKFATQPHIEAVDVFVHLAKECRILKFSD